MSISRAAFAAVKIYNLGFDIKDLKITFHMHEFSIPPAPVRIPIDLPVQSTC